MELVVLTKGNKYVVEDKKSRLLYSVKKKGFGNSRFVLLDSSNYNLYTLLQTGEERKPSFSIVLNDATFMTITCKSLFLDPTIICEGKNMTFTLASKDRREFTILSGNDAKGTISTRTSVSGDLQYDITVEDKIFDDYIPLFAVIIDRAFGVMNKQK
ncbi:MAG: hypothetical protein K2I06_07425 [Ruminococcus sp.]|nr:hypothetical protein [Ruminococcus sp.]